MRKRGDNCWAFWNPSGNPSEFTVSALWHHQSPSWLLLLLYDVSFTHYSVRRSLPFNLYLWSAYFSFTCNYVPEWKYLPKCVCVCVCVCVCARVRVHVMEKTCRHLVLSQWKHWQILLPGIVSTMGGRLFTSVVLPSRFLRNSIVQIQLWVEASICIYL